MKFACRSVMAVLASLTFSLLVQAAPGDSTPAVAGGSGKVVVVDLQRAVMSTTTAREQMKALQSEKDYVETRKKAESLQKDMEKRAAEAQKDGPTWTQEQQATYRNDMEFMQKNLQLAAQKIQTAEQTLFRKISKDMEAKLKQVLQQIIETDKISLMLDKGAAIYSTGDLDITDRVTDQLNQGTPVVK